MTGRLPELAGLPAELVLDGEIVAWDAGGFPSFPALCDRMLHRRGRAPVTYFVSDVLAVDGEPTTRLPYRERCRRLDQLDLNGPTEVWSGFCDRHEVADLRAFSETERGFDSRRLHCDRFRTRHPAAR